MATLDELTGGMADVLEGAAVTTASPLFLPVRNNRWLAARYRHNLADRDRAVVPVGPVPSGSTDMGNVSVRVPSIHPKIAIAPRSVSLHSAEFARWAGWERGDAGASTAPSPWRGPRPTSWPTRRCAPARAEFEAVGGVLDVPALDR